MTKDQKPFTALIDEYIVLKMPLDDYKPTSRGLPEGYRVHGAEVRDNVREDEAALLAKNFEHWSGPYEGTLKGWRENSPMYVLFGDRLVAGLYLCAQNEFDEGDNWGQVHYAFMHPDHKGKGVYSVLFARAVDKARDWRLKGLILNSDRHLLPEVYLRWGAQPWKRLQKPHRPKKPSFVRRVLRRIHPR
jgi:GNAT superfamily N-acetyltransferase